MRRRLFPIFSATSLALCVITLALWVSCIRWEGFVSHNAVSRRGQNWVWSGWTLWSQGGSVGMRCSLLETKAPLNSNWNIAPSDWNSKFQRHFDGPIEGALTSLQPRYRTSSRIPPTLQRQGALGYRATFVTLPYWLFVMIFSVLPMMWLRRRKRIWQLDHLICAVCGYDLRATPQRCPECGTVPSGA